MNDETRSSLELAADELELRGHHALAGRVRAVASWEAERDPPRPSLDESELLDDDVVSDN